MQGVTYTYDKSGNRATEVVILNGTSTLTTYVYNDQNRLTSTTSGSVVTNYSYDNNGNMLSKVVSGTTDTYTYDKYNRLKTLASNGKNSSFGYNEEGYRVKKIVDGNTTNYLYESDKVVLETNSSNQQTAYQVY